MSLSGNVYVDTDNILEDRPEGKSLSGEKLQTKHSDEVPKKMKKCEGATHNKGKVSLSSISIRHIWLDPVNTETKKLINQFVP